MFKIRICNCGSGEESRELLDARGIYCARVCDQCEESAKGKFRSEIFSNSNYLCDEQIEED